MATFNTIPDHPKNYESLLKEIDEIFSTEVECFEYFYKVRKESGTAICEKCSGTDFIRSYGSRFGKCTKCATKFWITSGTIFEKKKKIKAWITGIWLVANGLHISTPMLGILARISQSTAWQVLTTLSMVLPDCLEKGEKPAPSILFIRMICKRSRETARKHHPSQEIFDQFEDEYKNLFARTTGPNIENSNKNENTNSEIDMSINEEALSEIETKIISILNDEPISFDRICQLSNATINEVSMSLSMLEIKGLIKHVEGNSYVECVKRSELTIGELVLQELEKIPSGLINCAEALADFIRSKHHGISRKYLQGYLARSWTRFNRLNLNPLGLLKICLSHKPIGHWKIREYVSPYTVIMMS